MMVLSYSSSSLDNRRGDLANIPFYKAEKAELDHEQFQTYVRTGQGPLPGNLN